METIEERIEANANLILWCVHLLGADDLYAEPSHAAAVAAADKLNQHIGASLANKAHDLLSFAYAAPWPYSAERHAEDIKDNAELEANRKAAV